MSRQRAYCYRNVLLQMFWNRKASRSSPVLAQTYYTSCIRLLTHCMRNGAPWAWIPSLNIFNWRHWKSYAIGFQDNLNNQTEFGIVPVLLKSAEVLMILMLLMLLVLFLLFPFGLSCKGKNKSTWNALDDRKCKTFVAKSTSLCNFGPIFGLSLVKRTRAQFVLLFYVWLPDPIFN